MYRAPPFVAWQLLNIVLMLDPVFPPRVIVPIVVMATAPPLSLLALQESNVVSDIVILPDPLDLRVEYELVKSLIVTALRMRDPDVCEIREQESVVEAVLWKVMD